MVTILPALRQVREDLAGLLDRTAVERICCELGYVWRDRRLDPYGPGLDAAGVEYLRTGAPAESSDLVGKMRHVIDAEFSRAAVVRWYEWNRDLILWHENQTGDELPYGRYMYENDALGRRFAVTTEGIISGEARFNAFG